MESRKPDPNSPVVSSVRHGAAASTTTSTELLERLKRADDRTVWGGFVERYRPVVVGFARRRGLGLEDAEDAAQRTLLAFCQAYQAGQYDRQKGRLRKWLLGIAHNQICEVLRRRSRREMQFGNASDADDYLGQIADADHWEPLWEEEWRQAVLAQCLAEIREQVNPKTVQAFEMFVWKEQPAREVAQELGMSEHAVYLAKHRILRRMRELLPQIEEIW